MSPRPARPPGPHAPSEQQRPLPHLRVGAPLERPQETSSTSGRPQPSPKHQKSLLNNTKSPGQCRAAEAQLAPLRPATSSQRRRLGAGSGERAPERAEQAGREWTAQWSEQRVEGALGESRGRQWSCVARDEAAPARWGRESASEGGERAEIQRAEIQVPTSSAAARQSAALESGALESGACRTSSCFKELSSEGQVATESQVASSAGRTSERTAQGSRRLKPSRLSKLSKVSESSKLSKSSSAKEPSSLGASHNRWSLVMCGLFSAVYALLSLLLLGQLGPLAGSGPLGVGVSAALARQAGGQRAALGGRQSVERLREEQQQQEASLLVCPPGWQQHSNQCYKFFQQRHSWQRARDTCERHGAQLALIYDYQQNNFTGQLAGHSLLGPAHAAGAHNQLHPFGEPMAHQRRLQQSGALSAASTSTSASGGQPPVYASEERSYWIGYRAIDRLETNTLESAANTFVSKYLGFWDLDEPRVSAGECVRATIKHEASPLPAGASYRPIQQPGECKWRACS